MTKEGLSMQTSFFGQQVAKEGLVEYPSLAMWPKKGHSTRPSLAIF